MTGGDNGSHDDTIVTPEEQASLASRVLFLWAFPVAYEGFRRGRMDANHLLPLPRRDASDGRQECFRAVWRRRAAVSESGADSQRQRRGRRVLVPSLLAVARILFFRCMLLRFACAVFSYAQPMLLHTVLRNMEASGDGSEDTSLGTAFASVLLAMAVTCYWLCWESYWFMNTRLHSCLRNVLMHFTYRKALYIATVSSSGYSGGSLQNLMVTDAMRMATSYPCEAVFAFVEAMASVIFAACQLCFLLGPAAGLIGASVVATFVPLSFFMGRALRKYVKRIQQSRDARGTLLLEFFSAMRVVKCFNLETLAEAAVAQARAKELRWLRLRRALLPVINFVANSCGLLGVAAAFTYYSLVSPRGVLTAAQAFTTLAWMNTLNAALSVLPRSLTSLLDTLVSVGRLERLFLVETGEQWLCQLGGDASPPEPALADGELEPRFIASSCVVAWPLSLGGDESSSSAVGDQKQVFGSGLSFEIHRQELVLVCGPIGCGKSTLLSVLSHTVPLSSGRCSAASGRCALVAQRPWLFNGTLLENILFGQAFEAERLERVLRACALSDDLAALPDGDQTLVGEMGVQLSGGQRQRVSLARALYASDCDAVLLDDVLSALDAHVSQHVWEQAICGELSSRTRVLVTHQVNHCSDPRVSKILLLSSDGSQKFFGTYAELERTGWLSSLGVAKPTDKPLAVQMAAASGITAPAEKGSPFSGPAREVRAEARRTGGIAWSDFLVYANSCGGLFVMILVSLPILLYYTSSLLTNWELSRWTDQSRVGAPQHLHIPVDAVRRLDEATERDSLDDLKVYLALVGVTSLFRLVFMLVVQLASVLSSQRLYKSLMGRLLRLDLSFFETTPTGQILNRCMKDMAQIDDLLADCLLSVVQAWLDAITVSVVLSAMAPWSLFGVPPFCIGYAFVMRVYRWPARDLKRLEAVARSPIMNHFSDSIKGAATLRTYGHELRFMRKNLELVDGCARAFYTYWGVRSWNAMALEFLGSLLLIISVSCVAARAASGGLPPGAVGLALSYAMTMPRQLMWISINMANLETEFVAVERIAEYIRLLPEADVVPSSVDDPERLNALGTGLAVRGAWFRYKASGPWVLQGLSFDLPAGSRAAIVGRTGCGKSSLLAAAVRLYPLEGGQIFVQGRDAAATPLALLRRSARVLLQDPVLFAGTIRSNLLCLPGASSETSASSDDSLWTALRTVGLDEIVRSFGGLDASVQEAGGNLSQGQRQLLCLCRVLIDMSPGSAGLEGGGAAEPRLALCDEPTSNCDPATDATIHRVLLEDLPSDWTVVVICHRLRRVRSFHRVVVIEAGQVVEHGSPSELMADSMASAEGGPDERRWLREMCAAQGVP